MAREFNLIANLTLKGPRNLPQVIRQINDALNANLKGTIKLQVHANAVQNIVAFRQNLDRLVVAFVGVTAGANNASQAIKNFNTTVNGLGNRVRSARSQLQQLHASSRAAASSMENFGRQSAQTVQRFGAFTVATASIFKFISASQSAFVEALEFERELIKVAQVSGQTTVQLRGLEDEVGRLATKYGVSSKKLIDASQVLAQAGISAKDVKVSLEALALTELAPTFEKSTDTIEAMISMMQTFGIQAKDFQKVFGSINAVAGQFAVEATDITTAIRKVGASFKVSNDASKDGIRQLHELMALFTSVRHTTREGAETISTGLRTTFTRIQRKRTLDFLKDQGIDLTTGKGTFVGPFEAVGKLHEAFSKIPTNDNRFFRVVEELGGYRQVQKVIPLIQQYALAVRALGVAERGQNSLAKDAATAQESLLIQLTKVREEFLKLFRIFTHNGALREFVTVIKSIATTLTQAATAISPMIGPLTAFLAIKAAPGIRNFSSGFLSVFSGGNVGTSAAQTATSGAQAAQINATQSNTMALQRLVLLLEQLMTELGVVLPGLASPLSLRGSNTGGGGNGGGGGGGGSTPRARSNFRRFLPFGLMGLGSVPLLTNELLNQNAASFVNEGIGTIGFAALMSQIHGSNMGVRTIGRLGQGRGLFSRRNFLRVGRFAGKFGPAGGTLLAGIGAMAASRGVDENGVPTTGGIIGGALTGAGTGTAFGSLFGPFGAAIGGVVGGLTGLAMATHNAKIALEQFNNTKALDRLSSTIKNVLEGKTTVGAAAPTVISTLSTLHNKLPTTPDEIFPQLVNKFREKIPELELFGAELIKDSKSLKEFENAQGGLGRILLHFLAFAEDVPLKELRESYEKQIEVQNKANAITERLNKSQSDLFNKTTEFIQLANALRTSSFGTGRTSELISGFGINKTLPTLGSQPLSLLQNPMSATSSLDLQDLIHQITPNQNLASFAGDLAQTFQELPHILMNIRANPLDDDNVEKALADAFQDIPDFLSDQLISLIEHEFLGGERGSSAKLFRAIDDNVLKVVGTLFTSFKPIFDSLHEGAEILHSEIDKLGKGFEELVDLQLKEIEGRKRVEGIELHRFTHIRNLRQLPPDIGGVDSLANNIRGAALAGTNFGANSAASSIGDRLIEISKERLDVEEKLRDADHHNADQVTQLKERFAELTKESIQLIKALQDNEHIQAKINVREEKLQSLRGGREQRFNLIKQLFGASPSESIELRRNVAAASFISKTGRISGLPHHLRAGGLQILEQFGNSPFTPGGEPANRLIKRVIGNEMAAQGVNPQIISSLINATTEEEKLIQEINELINTEKDQAKVLTDVLGKQNKDLLDSLSNQFRDFLAAFENAQDRNINNQLDIKNKQLQGRSVGLDEAQSALNIVNKRFGGLKAARTLSSGVGSATQIKNEKGALGEFSTALSNFDLGKFNTKTELRKNLARELNKLNPFLTPQQKVGLVRAINSNFAVKANAKLTGENISDIRVPAFSNSIKSAVTGFLNPIIDERQKKLDDSLELLSNQFGTTKEGLKLFQQVLSLTTKEIDSLNKALSKLEGINSGQDIKNKRAEIDAERKINEALRPKALAGGGSIFTPRGTDTVPAMLTPGEFVVNRQAAQQNMGLLQAINSGAASYYDIGGFVHTNKKRRKGYTRTERHILSREEKIENLRQRRLNRLGDRKTRLERIRDGFYSPPPLTEKSLKKDRFVGAWMANYFNSNPGLLTSSANLDFVFRDANRAYLGLKPLGPPPSATMRANRRATGMAHGGIVGGTSYMFGGGSVANRNENSVNIGFSSIERTFMAFNTIGEKLADAISGMPHKIDFGGSHKVEVIINGAEAFNAMKPEIAGMIEAQVKSAFESLYKGPLQGTPRA